MPRLPDLNLPDIKFPKWKKLPEPVIDAPRLEYPELLWPTVVPRAAGKPPTDKPRQSQPTPIPVRKANDATEPGSGSTVKTAKEETIDTPEEVVSSIVEQIAPTLTLQAESINTLQQQIWDIQSDVQVEITELQETFETKEITEVTVPLAGWVVPLPKPAILVTAGTTAGVSVGATLTATWAFKRSVQVFKPAINALVKKIKARLGKPTQTWSRQRLEQRRRRSLSTD